MFTFVQHPTAPSDHWFFRYMVRRSFFVSQLMLPLASSFQWWELTSSLFFRDIIGSTSWTADTTPAARCLSINIASGYQFSCVFTPCNYGLREELDIASFHLGFDICPWDSRSRWGEITCKARSGSELSVGNRIRGAVDHIRFLIEIYSIGH